MTHLLLIQDSYHSLFYLLTEDYIVENVYVYDYMILQPLFTEAVENIEKLYPNLF